MESLILSHNKKQKWYSENPPDFLLYSSIIKCLYPSLFGPQHTFKMYRQTFNVAIPIVKSHLLLYNIFAVGAGGDPNAGTQFEQLVQRLMEADGDPASELWRHPLLVHTKEKQHLVQAEKIQRRYEKLPVILCEHL